MLVIFYVFLDDFGKFKDLLNLFVSNNFFTFLNHKLFGQKSKETGTFSLLINLLVDLNAS